MQGLASAVEHPDRRVRQSLIADAPQSGPHHLVETLRHRPLEHKPQAEKVDALGNPETYPDLLGATSTERRPTHREGDHFLTLAMP